LSGPETLASDAAEANQQLRVDLVDPEASFDSVAEGDNGGLYRITRD
jgi:hypothetical protein